MDGLRSCGEKAAGAEEPGVHRAVMMADAIHGTVGSVVAGAEEHTEK